jgi:hypothetical protein
MIIFERGKIFTAFFRRLINTPTLLFLAPLWLCFFAYGSRSTTAAIKAYHLARLL